MAKSKELRTWTVGELKKAAMDEMQIYTGSKSCYCYTCYDSPCLPCLIRELARRARPHSTKGGKR